MGPKIAKEGTKIDSKSMKNRGCVADAFLERFVVGLGAKKSSAGQCLGVILATIFGQKSKKWHPKKHAKIDAEKV